MTMTNLRFLPTTRENSIKRIKINKKLKKYPVFFSKGARPAIPYEFNGKWVLRCPDNGTIKDVPLNMLN